MNLGHNIKGCEDCKECMHKAPYFQILTEKELELLNRDRYSVRYRAGETILKQGTSATHVLSLIDGVVKLYIEGIAGKNVLLALQKPWGLLGGPGIHTDLKVHYTVTALTDTSICFINISRFKEVLNLNTGFASQLVTHISAQAVNMFSKIVSLTQKQMHGRMADGLLYLSSEFYGTETFDLLLSRQDLADLTAMSKDSAIRILKDFEREGVISIKGNMLSVLNMDQLEYFSMHG